MEFISAGESRHINLERQKHSLDSLIRARQHLMMHMLMGFQSHMVSSQESTFGRLQLQQALLMIITALVLPTET